MASGQTLVTFKPLENEPPSSNYATIDSWNNRPVLDFDPSTDEEAMFSAIFPRNYGGGGLTVYVHFGCDTSSTGNVVFQGAFERIEEDVTYLHVDNFAAFQSTGTVSVPFPADKLKVATITFTDGAQMDNIQTAEYFRFKLRRDADSTTGTDDCPDDIQFLGIEIKET